jgi:hypothetical protein
MGVPGMPRRQAKVRLGSAMRSTGATGAFELQHKRPIAAGLDPAGAEDKAWLRGFGLALAEIRRLYDCSSVIEMVMRNASVTPTMLAEAGLEDFDLNEIKKCWRVR